MTLEEMSIVENSDAFMKKLELKIILKICFPYFYELKDIASPLISCSLALLALHWTFKRI